MAENIKKEGTKSRKGMVRFIVFVFIFLLGGSGVYYIAKTRPSLLGLAKSSTEVQSEVDALVSEVGKLIALPSDETPTVATVNDPEKVKTQAFFKNAQKDDKVLLYSNAKKAILYRPTEKKIIEVGAVNITQGNQNVEKD